MKKQLLFIGIISFILIIGFLVYGCSAVGSPTNVIRKLHTAVEKGDANTITELVTSDTSGLILKMLQDLQRSYAATGGIARTQETINGNNAVVIVTYKNGDTDQYDLVRIDGKWKATIRK
jgi:hypothetical protein